MEKKGGLAPDGEETLAENLVNLTMHSPESILEANPVSRWSATDRNASATDIALRKIKGCLNKVSVSNFEKLSGQIADLASAGQDVLAGTIELVYDKAVTEYGFGPMYSDLCVKLSRPEVLGKQADCVDFRTLLLRKCQCEFQNNFENLEDLACEGPSGVLGGEEEKRLKLKIRRIGNVKFIGELYKRDLLSAHIMHICIRGQLCGAGSQPVEEEVESVCELLTTIGKRIDSGEDSRGIDLYFKRITELRVGFSSRIRCITQDLADLRLRGWKSRESTLPALQALPTSAASMFRSAREFPRAVKRTGGHGCDLPEKRRVLAADPRPAHTSRREEFHENLSKETGEPRPRHRERAKGARVAFSPIEEERASIIIADCVSSTEDCEERLREVFQRKDLEALSPCLAAQLVLACLRSQKDCMDLPAVAVGCLADTVTSGKLSEHEIETLIENSVKLLGSVSVVDAAPRILGAFCARFIMLRVLTIDVMSETSRVLPLRAFTVLLESTLGHLVEEAGLEDFARIYSSTTDGFSLLATYGEEALKDIPLFSLASAL